MAQYFEKPTGLREDTDVHEAGNGNRVIGYVTTCDGYYHATEFAGQFLDRANWSANSGENFTTRDEAVKWIIAQWEGRLPSQRKN